MPSVKTDNLVNRGLLLCSRYALPPNWLQYCGGDNPQEILAYNQEQMADLGLVKLLKEFQTMYPYLQMIAAANQIPNPLDYRVVEAYWLGNELLKNITKNSLYNFLIDDLLLKKKIKSKHWQGLNDKIISNPLPHHSWHVFNVFTRTGHLALEHTVETMDNCKISWGKVLTVKTDKLIIETKSLVMTSHKLNCGPMIIKNISYQPTKTKIIQIGDLVSFHWNCYCDTITKQQALNLDYFTKQNLALANLTL